MVHVHNFYNVAKCNLGKVKKETCWSSVASIANHNYATQGSLWSLGTASKILQHFC